MLTQIINARILTPQGWLKDGSVLIRDNKILEVTNCDLAIIGAKLIDADSGFIGGFTLEEGRLIWTRSSYFGGTSRSLKLGSGRAKEGVVNVTFDAATDGNFGVAAIGASFGIYSRPCGIILLFQTKFASIPIIPPSSHFFKSAKKLPYQKAQQLLYYIIVSELLIIPLDLLIQEPYLLGCPHT